MVKEIMPLVQNEVEKRFRALGRENTEELLTFLRESGYYTARCHRHHHFKGGTSQHSLETLYYALERNTTHIPEESLIVVCLLHDVCDIHGFDHYRRHGSRSVSLITQVAHYPLSDEERLAILHHMHSPHRHPEKFGADFDKVTNSPLWKLQCEADHYSAGHTLSRYALADKIQLANAK